jgi:glyoxylase-like metal-dependent hydrolase (beta-lactamase superfamily II)
MIAEIMAVGPLQVNATLIGCEETKIAMITDPGGDVNDILARLSHHGLKLEIIALTHAHADHVGGIATLKEQTQARIYMHLADQEIYDAAPAIGRMFGFSVNKLPPVDRYIQENDVFSVGQIAVKVIETPGHTPGGVTFHLKADHNKDILIAGDTLFLGSIGRTDLPGGNFNDLMSSIKNKIFQYPDETVVITGHGPMTSVGKEKATNPFVN